MTEGRAEQLIVISLAVLLGSTVGGQLREGDAKHPKKYYGKAIVGGFLFITACSLLAEAAPEVGALFAMSGAGYAFFHYGLPAIKYNPNKQEEQQALKEAQEGIGKNEPPEDKKLEQENKRMRRELGISA